MTIPSNNFKKISFLFYVGSVMLISSVSAYFNEVYNGYLFTLPNNTEREMRTQTDAREWCKNNSNTLAEIYDGSFQEAVVMFLRRRVGTDLSGWNTMTNGKMSLVASWNWVNGKPTGVNVDGQTNGFYSFGSLQRTNGGPRIVTSLPYERRSYICEGQSYCNGGVVARCFRNFTGSLTWFEARNFCLREGGDLASFDSSVQGLGALVDSLLSSGSTYWIGARRQWWTWQESNTEMKFSQWDSGQPNSGDACLCITPWDWKWSTCNCDTKYQFICVSERNTTTIATTSATTSRSATIRNSTNIRILTIAERTTNEQNGLTSPSTPSSPIAIAPSIKETQAVDVDATRLGVGLGVGIGGGILIIVVIIVVILFVRRQRLQRSFKNQKPFKKPDIVQSSDSPYALIPHQVSPGSGLDVTGVDQSNPSVVYADIQIISGSLSSDETVSRSARLTSQYPTQKNTTHISVDGVEYGTVTIS